MTHTMIGYARCSTDKQDLTAQKGILAGMGIAPDRISPTTAIPGRTERGRGSIRHWRLSGPETRWSYLNLTAWPVPFPMPGPSPTRSPRAG